MNFWLSNADKTLFCSLDNFDGRLGKGWLWVVLVMGSVGLFDGDRYGRFVVAMVKMWHGMERVAMVKYS